jgi:hypothetical protein
MHDRQVVRNLLDLFGRFDVLRQGILQGRGGCILRGAIYGSPPFGAMVSQHIAAQTKRECAPLLAPTAEEASERHGQAEPRIALALLSWLLLVALTSLFSRRPGLQNSKRAPEL